MGLFKCINGLLKGTKYLAWGIGVVGIIISVVLFFANIPLGFASAAVFIATFFLAIAVSLLLLPGKLAKGILSGKFRYILGSVALVIALVVIAVVYFSNGGFPELDLLFV